MTTDQILLFSLFAIVLGMLLWGRFRYDLVAAIGLLSAVALGLVPQEETFSGFSNPAVVVVALVLVASKAFENSGALAALAERMLAKERPIGAHILLTSGFGAVLSAFINNVAALAMLMPLDIRAARKAKRPPGLTLMPLAFATILGGMITLIGTPPNIVASAIRAERLGQPYSMFDFAPVGLAVAAAGLLFVAFLGWRLVPARKDELADLTESASFNSEIEIPDNERVADLHFSDLEEAAESADVLIAGLRRDGKYTRRGRGPVRLQPGDILVVRGGSEGIAAFVKTTGIAQPKDEEAAEEGKAPKRKTPEKKTPEKKPSTARKPAAKASRTASATRKGKADAQEKGEENQAREPEPQAESGIEEALAELPRVVEAVVRGDSRIIGRNARQLRLRSRERLVLLGISHTGTVHKSGLIEQAFEAGDVLLLSGAGSTDATTLHRLGLIVVNRLQVDELRPWRVALTVGIFIAAILAATLGLTSFTIAITMAVAVYAALGLVGAREFYEQIPWPIVVLLACFLPLGAAFERLGGTGLIAGSILGITEGYPPIVLLILVMVVTMILSDVLNNVATIVVMGPVGLDLAQRLSVNPDTFLMGVTLAASCAFLTPIGHNNNTLIMGPGGFRFGDYWQLGLPLELIVLVVSIPMLLIVWPL